MNRNFMLSNLLDGEYNYETKELKFNLKRHVWNYFVFFTSFCFFLNHLIIFITDNDYLKHELVSFRMFEDAGERISNMAIGMAILGFGWIIIVYKRFYKDQSGLDKMRFLFCFNEKIMEREFYLSPNLAKKQVSYQKIFLRGATLWHQFYFISLFAFTCKLAVDDLSKLELGFYFFIKCIFYSAIFIEQQASLGRVFIIFGHMNLTCIYFHHCLKTLNIKMLKLTKLQGILFDKQLMKVNKRYNEIIKDQRELNHHFGSVFYFFHVFNSFTVIYPIHILFIDPNETLLIAFDLVNYLNIVFLVFLPVILSNGFFTRTNLKFAKNCYLLSPYLTKISNKIKMFNIYTLNTTSHSISFNFKHFMNYSLYLFIFWIMESICLVILFYATINVLKK